MVRIGTAGYPPGSKDAEDALCKLASAGLEALEVQFVRQISMSLERAEQLGEASDAANIRLSAHAPYYVNFNSDSKNTREKSVFWVVETMRRAAAMRAKVIVVHAASYGKQPENASQAVKDGLSRVREVLGREGSDVLIGLETMGKKWSWGSIEEIATVCKEVKGTIPVIDFAHIHARSGGGLKNREAFCSVLESARSILDMNLHCHVSGVEYGESGEKRHLSLDSGDPDYTHLVALKEELDGGTLIVESPMPFEDAVRLKAMMES